MSQCLLKVWKIIVEVFMAIWKYYFKASKRIGLKAKGYVAQALLYLQTQLQGH